MKRLLTIFTITTSAMCFAVGPVAAADHALDLSVSGDAVRGAYGRALQAPSLDLEVGWLHNEDDGDVVDAGLHAIGVLGKGEELDVGVGGRLLWADSDFGDGAAIALGVVVGWTVPRAQRVRLELTAHYAPDVVAFGDLEEYLQTSFSVSFLVVNRAQIYAGYRLIDVELENVPRSIEIDDGFHVGVRIGL